MTWEELRDYADGDAPEHCWECRSRHRPSEECPLVKHQRNEGDRYYNEHPDGCYFCGSMSHHSSDCRYDSERDEWGY